MAGVFGQIGYWQLYEAYLQIKDDKRQWRLYRADNFGEDMFIVSCDIYNDKVVKQMEAFPECRYLGPSNYKKDEKGVSRCIEWHWLVKIPFA